MVLHCSSIHSPNEGYFHCIQDLAIMKTAAAAKSLQSCLTLCNPMDCNLPGSSDHGIFHARVLEWVNIAFFGNYEESCYQQEKKDMVFIDEHLTLKSADFPKASRLSLSCLAPLCVLLGCWVSAPGFVLSLWLPPTAAHATQRCSDSYPWSPNLDCFLWHKHELEELCFPALLCSLPCKFLLPLICR